LWSIASPESLSLQFWVDDDLSVAYNKITGDTHLLAASAVEILQLIGDAPASANVIEEKLACLFAMEDRDKITEFVSATLLQLQDIGLVVKTPA
jgi:PqqD family protein of HPr-rel-A system